MNASDPIAPEPPKYDDVLLPFLALMRHELHANSGKGDRPGWLSMSRETAMLEIWHHVAKLQKAALNEDLPATREYAADVANMAMMLLDVCGGIDALASPVRVGQFDFVGHLRQQAAFSERTFGPGQRVKGVCDHIRKELVEVESEDGPLAEWVDVIILALDGAWRSGATPEEIVAAIVAKQEKNERRRWPDWGLAPPDRAIEHDRTDERA